MIDFFYSAFNAAVRAASVVAAIVTVIAWLEFTVRF